MPVRVSLRFSGFKESNLWLSTSRPFEYKPTIKAPSKKGDVIFSVLVRLAALITLLLLSGIIVSLIFASLPSMQKFGFAFLWSK